MALAAQDLLFFKAATGERPEAAEAWLRINRELDLDSPTPAQYGVLPLLYRNLSKHSVEHPEMHRLKGMYKYVWVANQVRLSLMAEAVARLRCEGMEPRIAGDVALAVGYFDDPGARRIRSLCLEVADCSRAAGLLVELGWRAIDSEPRFVRQDRRIGLVSFELGRLKPPDSESEKRGGSICLGRATVEIPGPSQQLLAVCREAGRREGPTPLGPAVDFVVISRKFPGAIDWGWVRHRCRDEGCDEVLEILAGLAGLGADDELRS